MEKPLKNEKSLVCICSTPASLPPTQTNDSSKAETDALSTSPATSIDQAPLITLLYLYESK